MLTWEKILNSTLIWKYFVIQLNIFALITKKFWKTGVLSHSISFFSSIFAFKILWHKKYIKIDNKTFNKAKIARKSLNFDCQVLKEEIKSLNNLKIDFSLEKKTLESMQIFQAILRSWKIKINNLAENFNNLIIQEGHHLIIRQQIRYINVLNAENEARPSAQECYYIYIYMYTYI